MTADNSTIEIRLAGDDIRPETVRARDVAEIIAAFEQMVAVQVVADYPELALDEETITIGLVGIAEGSLQLTLSSQLYEYTNPVVDKIALALKTKDYSAITNETRKQLNKLAKVARGKQAKIEFRQKQQLLAVIEPTTVVAVTPNLTGNTTLYGIVTRVGGKGKPRVQFESVTGELLYLSANRRTAKQLASRLYEEVGVVGNAVWDPETLEVVDFTVESIVDRFSAQPLTDVFDQIREQVSQIYDGIDTDEFLSYARDVPELSPQQTSFFDDDTT